MFGYAINETGEQMPMPIYYSHKILKELSYLRKEKKVSFLRPDSKSQISVDYRNGIPTKITNIVLSTQHSPDVQHSDIQDFVIEECIKKVIPANLLKECEYYINPTGIFVIGGPHGDCGLTGRKIIVDTYGGMGRHGGGAFSGKDPSKVDRSAAYMMRYIAKNIVASGIADVCELQVAYAIGVSKPMSVMIHTFGTGKVDDKIIEASIIDNFDLTPSGIRKKLTLRSIPYLPSAAYGHFGRSEDFFTWEKTDSKEIFSSLL